MPSNWYAEFMRLNGFDVEDPYFQEKRQAFTPEPLGKMFENDKDITDYFQSGGEYDKAAGDATGLWGNTLDLGLRASKGLVGGLVGAAGVVTDLADTAATEISDLTGFKKGGLFADATDSARNFRSQADEAVSEGMAMPKNDFTLANPLGNYEGAEGIGGFLKATGKTAQDIAYSGAEIGADMVGAAAAGWAMGGLGFQGGAAAELAEGAGLGAKALAYGKDVLSSNVAKGFQMSGFADMYESHTQGDGDSRLKAAAIAAPYAVTTGLLEGIGAIETFGAKTLSKYLVKDSAANWVGRRAAAGVLGAMAEGGTEYPQQWLQIVAEELPSNSVNDKDPLSAWKRITDRSPEAWQAALGGALFGGPVGMITGLETVHKADAKALEAGSATDPKPKTPDEAVADIVGGVKTPVNIAMQNASDSLLDMSDDLIAADKEAVGSAQVVADASVKALENREKLEQKVRQEIVGDAASENAIIQTAPEEHIVSLLGGVTNSIDSLVARDLAQFDNINLGWQNFMASVASGQPTDLGRPKNQFDDVNALAGVALEAGIDPQAMAKATAARFEQIGVDPSVFANGLSSVDLGAIRGQLEQELRQKYAEKSMPVVDAIDKARTPEEGSDIKVAIDAVKEMAGPQTSENDAYSSAVDFIKTVPFVTAKNLQDALGLSRDKSRAMAARLEKEGLVGPQVGNKPRQVLLTQEEKQLPATEVMERRSPESVDTPKESVAKRLLSYISDKVRSTVFTDEREAMTKTLSLEWMTKPFRLASPGSSTFEDLYSDDVDTLAAIKNVSSAATREEYIQRATEKIKSDVRVSNRFHEAITAPFVAKIADLKIKHDQLSAAVNSGANEQELAETKKEIAKEVRVYRRQLVRQAIPPGIARSVHDAKMAALDSYMRASDALDMEKYGEVDQQKRERTKAAMGKRLFTEPINLRNSTDLSSESAPAAKIVGMWLYTNANPELSKKIIAKMLGEEGTIESNTQLANELARELSNDGLYESLVDEDAFTQRAFMESIVNQGKSISSPHGLYIALTQAGEDPAVAISTVAGLHAASLNNHARTGESLTTFWDRLSDHIMTAPEIAQKEAPGGLFVTRGRKPVDNYSGTRLRDFARDAIYVLGRSFDSVKHSQSIVMQHEIMHAMHHSGLLRDIVGPEGLAAIEKVTGKLYNSDGSPIWNERTAERLATAWEIFLATQKAPNAETQSAFDAAKEFFRTYLNTVLNMFNKTFKRGDWDLTGDRGRPMQYATGKNSASESYGDLYQQLEANRPAIKALYRLVYAQPNSEAHMATGGLVGASSALMSEMSDIAGIDMSDVMTKTAKLDSRPDTIELNGKLVKIDKSEEDDSSVEKRWDENIKLTGLSDDLNNELTKDLSLYSGNKKQNTSILGLVNADYFGSIGNLDQPGVIFSALAKLYEFRQLTYQKHINEINNYLQKLAVETGTYAPPKIVVDDDFSFANLEQKVGPSLPFFPRGRKVTADDLPDAAEANATRWFHGSRIPDIHEKGISSVKGAVGIMGTGGYLTDSPYQGDRYRTMRARNKGTDPEVGDLYALKVNVRNVINLEKPLDLDVEGIWLSQIEGDVEHYRVDFPEISEMLIDLQTYILTGEKTGSRILDRMVSVYSNIERTLENHFMRPGKSDISRDFFNRLEVANRSNGYDAYTHIGGVRTGNDTQHRVLILLDPSNELSNEYPPSVVKYWPTRRVGVEHGPFERKVVGWTPESDTEITKDQLSDSLGFQGMNPEDSLVIEALDKHEDNVGTRLSNWSAPVERRTVPMMSSGIDKKKQKVAETLLKNGASLRPSQSAADWLQEVSDMLITDSKTSPMYNNEEIDFTSVTGIKTLLTEFPRLTRRFIDYAKVNGNMAAINKALPFIGKANLRGIVTQWTKAEKNFANVLASLEGAVEHLGLPNVAMHINNMFSLSRWAGDITERVPMYYDEEQQDWVIIPGSESWRNITNDLIAWQEAYFKAHGKEIPSKTMAQFSVKSQRDLRLWMLAQRELEVFEHSQRVVQEHMDAVAEWEQKVRDGKTTEERPAAPKIPHISEAAVTLAKNVKMVLEMTYGDDIKTLDMMSLRYSKWESDSKLVPLLKSKLITAKQYADMMSAGMRHVPFARVAELVKSSGAVNVNVDGSMYAVLDYLKQDLTFKVQDPLLAAIKSVQAVNILTQRQIAKNAIGKAVMDSVPAGVPNGEFVVLHSKRKISKEEYDKLPDDQREEKQEKPAVAIGTQESKDSAKQYYQIVPATKDDIGEVLAQLRHRLQGLKGSKREEAEILMNGGIFAAYLEPNNPVYIRILDAEVAQAFYTMNNPQVLYATSAHAQMLGRTQKWFKGQYVTSPQFIFNQLFRDIPNAITRSKHGLRLSDIGRGIVASLQMSGFEDISSRMDKDGAAAGVSEDALKGFGPFGGLVSSVGPGGNMDVDLLIAASHDGANTQNARGLSSAFTAFYENMKKHGAVFPSFKNVIDATKTGDWTGVKDNALMLPKLVFSLPRAIMSVPASVLENGPRLAERRLMMDVDMTQYPEIMKRFPDRYKVDANGQALAGYAGTLHRRAWEAAEKRLKNDPNAVVAVEDLPIQYTAMNRDFDTRHITLPFDQKGKWTPTIDLFHVFFGPAMLDMYTTLKQIGNNTATQSVLDVIRSSEDVAKRKSKLNYNKRSVLGKEFTYTDEDGRALAMLIKAVGVITIPALAQALVYHDDDEWQAQSFTEKLGYYHIKTPWGGRLRIARGLGFMQLLFSDLPTAAILQFGDKDPKAMKKWLNRFFQSTPLGAVAAGPISYLSGDGAATAIKKGFGEWTPEIAKGTTEGLMFDYDTFREKQVSYETGFSPQDPTRVKSERYNILANTIARIEGVQPSQARHQVESLFPGTKALIPWLANKGMEATYGATGGLPDDVEASNAPIYGQGTGGVVRIYSKSPFGVGNEFVQSLYKLDRKLTGYYNSAEKMPDTAKKIYEAGHPELKHRDLVHDAVEKINGYQDKVMELRKDGIAKNDNGLTEYDLNKLMTIQAMEVYRLFYGKLLGQ